MSFCDRFFGLSMGTSHAILYNVVGTISSHKCVTSESIEYA